MLVLSRKSQESVVVGGADRFECLLKVTVLPEAAPVPVSKKPAVRIPPPPSLPKHEDRYVPKVMPPPKKDVTPPPPKKDAPR